MASDAGSYLLTLGGLRMIASLLHSSSVCPGLAQSFPMRRLVTDECRQRLEDSDGTAQKGVCIGRHEPLSLSESSGKRNAVMTFLFDLTLQICSSIFSHGVREDSAIPSQVDANYSTRQQNGRASEKSIKR